MADIIFKNYRQISDENLEGWAKEIGLDVEQFKTDFASDAVKAEVQKDMKAAQASGAVRGTPTILINGRKFQGQRTVDGFKTMIESELKEAEKLIKAGTKVEDVYKKRCSAPS